MSDVTVLCAADLHLGRRPAGLPAGERVSSADGWTALVDRATADGVDLVVLAGDVVDRLNRSFEAYGPLESGVAKLGEAGIPVVAVAGNHDCDTLADVADEVGGGLRVLGRGGSWERWTLRGEDGSPRLHVDGWSFPERSWHEDPTRDYDPGSFGDPGDVPVLGLVHGDLYDATSRYGPLSRSRLRGLPVDLWVLGHIHVPAVHDDEGAAPILYPGSPQALDSGETGPHGAHLVTLAPARRPKVRPVALSSVRFDRVEVDVDGVADEAGIMAAVRRELRGHLEAIAVEAAGPLRVIQARVELAGRTPVHGRIESALAELGGFETTVEDLRLVADPRPVVRTRPALDLESLADGTDAPALLARLLLSLDADPPELPDEVAALVSRRASAAAGAGHYVEAGLGALDLTPGSDRVRAGVRRQAGRLLDALMAQKKAS